MERSKDVRNGDEGGHVATPPYNVDAGAVSMIVSIFLFLIISLMDAPVKIDADVETVMEL